MLPNFSWFIENAIAASSIPSTVADFKFLKKQGISHLINLTNQEYDAASSKLGNFQLHKIPITDFTAPTTEQMDEFVTLVTTVMDAGESLLVHCHAGCGRTGTMLAAWMIASGSSAQEAIKWTRGLRSCSIETEEQEQALEIYYLSQIKN